MCGRQHHKCNDKQCFLVVNVVGTIIAANQVFWLLAGNTSESEEVADTVDECDTLLHVAEIDEDALNVAWVAFGICGTLVYPFGIFGLLKRNKMALQCYIVGMIVIAIVHVAFLVIVLVHISDIGIDKDSYTECFEEKVDNFYENVTVTDDFLIENFKRHTCCYPDGDMVEFWKNTNWHPDPTLPHTDHDVEVPIQCCKNNQSDTCRIKGGDEDRLTASCWDEIESFLKFQIYVYDLPKVLICVIAVGLDVFLMYAVNQWLKSLTGIQHEEPTYELQGQIYHAPGQITPPHQPAYQVQGQTQPAYQAEYQTYHTYPPQGQSYDAYPPQGQTSCKYQPHEQTSSTYQPQWKSSSTDQPQGQTYPAYTPPHE